MPVRALKICVSTFALIITASARMVETLTVFVTRSFQTYPWEVVCPET